MQLRSRRAGLVAFLGVSILASGALASEIYRYTDEDGNVHFTDRPTGESDEQRVPIDSQPTDNAAVQARFTERFSNTDVAPADGSATVDENEEENRKPTRAERQRAAAEREQECARLRERYELLYAARRVFQDNPDGERTYLNDEELAAERERARKQIEETCD